MNNHTLAETLREWVELDSTIRTASDACADAQNRAKKLSWDRTVVAARDYLRGYDDAMREQIVDNHALASENDELKHRVQELEAQLAAPQPVAVGVVGAVRWGALALDGFTIFQVETSREKAEMLGRRVVAIVDLDAIVPLASQEPAFWRDDETGDPYDLRCDAASTNTKGVTPLYPGLAQQPAQERDQ